MPAIFVPSLKVCVLGSVQWMVDTRSSETVTLYGSDTCRGSPLETSQSAGTPSVK